MVLAEEPPDRDRKYPVLSKLYNLVHHPKTEQNSQTYSERKETMKRVNREIKAHRRLVNNFRPEYTENQTRENYQKPLS